MYLMKIPHLEAVKVLPLLKLFFRVYSILTRPLTLKSTVSVDFVALPPVKQIV